MNNSPFDWNVCPTMDKNNAQLQAAGYIDASGNLVPVHDAATMYLGEPWRMPTRDEFDALVVNCATQWTTRNGVSGRLVTGKGAYSTKSIFLPAAGGCRWFDLGRPGSYVVYWSSTPYSGNSGYGWHLGITADACNCGNALYRFNGQSVRPVRVGNK